MSDEVSRFVGMMSLIIVSLVAGQIIRRTGVLDTRRAGTMMFWTVVLGWTPVAMVSVWNVTFSREVIILPFAGVILAMLGAIPAWLISLVHRLERSDRGTYICAAGLKNLGFTGGGFVCYALFGEQGLGLSQIYLGLWMLAPTIVFFTIAAHHSDAPPRLHIGDMLRSIVNLRSLPLAGVVTGLVLSSTHVPLPTVFHRWYLLPIMLYACVALTFFIIGVQLSFGKMGSYRGQFASMAACQFLAIPAVNVGLVALIQWWFGPLEPKLMVDVMYVQSFMPTAIFAVFAANLFKLNPQLASLHFIVNSGVFLVVVLPILWVVFT